MTEGPGQKNGNPILCTLTLVAVLAISITAAWHLSRKRTESSTRGAETIAAMRKTGLQKLGYADSSEWWLVYDGKTAIGWKASFVAKKEGNSYGGVDILHIEGQSPITTRNFWELTDNLSSGRSSEKTDDPNRPASDVSFSGGKLELYAQLGQAISHRQTAIPGNFLPEGAFDAAIKLLANTKEKVKFTIASPESGSYGGLGYLTLEYQPLAPGQQENFSAKVTGHCTSDKSFDVTCWLDAEKKVVRIDYPTLRFIIANKKEVTSLFPNAEKLTSTLLSAAEF